MEIGDLVALLQGTTGLAKQTGIVEGERLAGAHGLQDLGSNAGCILIETPGLAHVHAQSTGYLGNNLTI
jgi:hypothetical protein